MDVRVQPDAKRKPVLEASSPASEPAPNASTRAYLAISTMIKDRDLKGGQSLVEQRLADQLGVSRTPLREALQRLEGEGLVRKLANQPYVVRQVDLSDYLQSLNVRKVLEAEAAALAAGRIAQEAIEEVRQEVLALEALEPYDTHAHWANDDRVHNLFIQGCGNRIMADMLYELRTTTRLFEIAQLADRLGPDSREHLAILDALAAEDANAARKAMAAHAQSLFDFALRFLG
jgi:DNA-binding GntR family transcriptional regulator